MSTIKINVRPLNIIAQEIVKDWKKVNFAAVPYLTTMLTLDSIEDGYGCNSGMSIVLYFLSYSSTWKGKTAKRIKLELVTMIK